MDKAIVMGIDYGEKNVGLALGRNGLVNPIKTISNSNPQLVVHEIIKIALENNIDQIVVGLPLTFDNKETIKSRQVREFVKRLRIFFKKKIDFETEHDSTKDALAHTNYTYKVGKSQPKIDHISAAVILKRYFDNNS